jgi:hypothetical protein
MWRGGCGSYAVSESGKFNDSNFGHNSSRAYNRNERLVRSPCVEEHFYS